MKKKLSLILTILVLATVFSAFGAPTASAADKIVYVKDGGTGDGLSESSPIGKLEDAINLIANDGGTVMLVGDVTKAGNFTEPRHAGAITISSKGDAALILKSGSYRLNGDVTFKDLAIEASGSGDITIFSYGFNCTIGTKGQNDVTVTNTDNRTNYIYVSAGGDGATIKRNGKLTINSGSFGGVRLGSGFSGGTVEADINLEINGGYFEGGFHVGSVGLNYTQVGNTTVTFNGGTFKMNFFNINGQQRNWMGTEMTSSITGDITFKINGGDWTGAVRDCMQPQISEYVTNNGKITIDCSEFNGDYAEIERVLFLPEGFNATLISKSPETKPVTTTKPAEPDASGTTTGGEPESPKTNDALAIALVVIAIGGTVVCLGSKNRKK